MQQTVPFMQVDVFSAVPLRGNPLAIVFEAEGLSADQMQAIARWTNLSETAFVLPSEVADYRLRIYTPNCELPFAGHPTIGSAHAVLEHGLVDTRTFTMECERGIITLQQQPEEGGLLAWLDAPQRIGPETAPATVSAALELDMPLQTPTIFDVGPVWLVDRMESVKALYDVAPDMGALAAVSVGRTWSGVTLYAADDAGAIHVRSFAPSEGIDEDPVCGSGNLCVLGHMHAYDDGLVRPGYSHVAHQGRALGRDGRVRVVWGEDGKVGLGGQSVTAIKGTLRV
ncbi:MAG: PhzF family phenazine biosynthesis protein [Myxococcota bacterium]